MAPPRGCWCGFYNGQAYHTGERDWLNLCAALAAPLLGRLREQRHHQQLERVEALQGLLGTGWWELLPATQEIQLAPQLLRNLSLDEGPTRQPLGTWLELIHPADRQALNSRLQDLQALGKPLLTSVAPATHRVRAVAPVVPHTRPSAGRRQ